MKFIYFAYETWSHADYTISEKTLAYETRINKLVGIKNSKIATSHSYKGIGDLTCFEICNENNNKNVNENVNENENVNVNDFENTHNLTDDSTLNITSEVNILEKRLNKIYEQEEDYNIGF